MLAKADKVDKGSSPFFFYHWSHPHAPSQQNHTIGSENYRWSQQKLKMKLYLIILVAIYLRKTVLVKSFVETPKFNIEKDDIELVCFMSSDYLPVLRIEQNYFRLSEKLFEYQRVFLHVVCELPTKNPDLGSGEASISQNQALIVVAQHLGLHEGGVAWLELELQTFVQAGQKEEHEFPDIFLAANLNLLTRVVDQRRYHLIWVNIFSVGGYHERKQLLKILHELYGALFQDVRNVAVRNQ